MRYVVCAPTHRYHELLRISGENDRQKVWGSAAKFELMLWSNSPDRVRFISLVHCSALCVRVCEGLRERERLTGGYELYE